MRSRRERRIDDLRTAVECLPVKTRLAMLEGIKNNTIIVGAYTDRKGGVCPMLAAHRAGGRTDLIAFARAWDRFTAAGKRSRPATPHELAVLKAQLDGSLLQAEGRSEFSAAIAEHQTVARRRRGYEAQRLGLGWLKRDEFSAVPAEADAEPGVTPADPAVRDRALV